MSTKNKFIAYAKEHFDSTPTEYDVEFYADYEEPILDISDPAVSVEVQFTGTLSNPFDRADLFQFCKEHNIPVTFSDEFSYNDSDVIGVLDCDCTTLSASESASATEADDFLEDLAAMMSKGKKGSKVDKSIEKDINNSNVAASNLGTIYRRNEDSLQKLAVTGKMDSNPDITPQDAVRYYVSELAIDSKSFYIVVLEKNAKGNIVASMHDVAAGVTGVDDYAKRVRDGGENPQILKLRFMEPVKAILKNIVAKKGKGVIAGYTTNQALANKVVKIFQSGGLDESKGSPDSLNQLWQKANNVRDRYQILKKLLGTYYDKLSNAVIVLLAEQDKLFGSAAWEMIKYQRETPGLGTPISEKVLRSVLMSEPLQDVLDDGKNLAGLDLSTQKQISIIYIGLNLDDKYEGTPFIDSLKGTDGKWLPADAMETIAKKGVVEGTESKTWKDLLTERRKAKSVSAALRKESGSALTQGLDELKADFIQNVLDEVSSMTDAQFKKMYFGNGLAEFMGKGGKPVR